MTPAESLHALAKFAHTRDEAAFSRVVHAHIDLVYAAARRQVIDPGTADDVTQAVFTLLARKAGRLTSGTLLPGWLLRATRYCAADANRARARRRRHEREAAMSHKHSAESPTRAVDYNLLERLDAALSALRPTDRAVIAMRYLQAEPLDTVAVALGVSPEAAKKRTARALDRLRKRLTIAGQVPAVAVLTTALADAAQVHAPAALSAMATQSAIKTTVVGGTTAWLTSLVLPCAGVAVGMLVVSAVWLYRHAESLTSKFLIPISTTATTHPTSILGSFTPQQREVYEHLATLRESIPPSRPNEWIPPLRELERIGPAAVPALCDALDRSDSDKEQRLLVMALRYIRDPRAVPAVLRAVPRFKLTSGDYGVAIEDPALRMFLDARYWDQSKVHDKDEYSSFNRGITEAVATLEAITGHTEGHALITDWPKRWPDHRMSDAPPTTDPTAPAREAEWYRAQDAAIRTRRAEFVSQWQMWWDTHRDEWTTAAGRAEVEAARYDTDPVAAVLAARPPRFPTGPSVQLSEVYTFDVPLQGLADVSSHLDLAGARLVRADENPRDASASQLTDSRTSRRFAELFSNDVKTWQVAPERFDAIEQDVQAGGRLDLGQDVPRDGFRTYDLSTNEFNEADYPATFFFETPTYRTGILRIDRQDPLAGVHLQYRLWPTPCSTQQAVAQHAVATTLPATRPSGYTYDLAREATLKAPADFKLSEAIDDNVLVFGPTAFRLTDGQTLSIDVEADKVLFSDAKRAWTERHQADLLLATTKHGKPFGLVLLSSSVVVPVSEAAWDHLSVDDAIALVGNRRNITADNNLIYDDRARKYGIGTGTYLVFFTRTQKSAVFQILTTTDDALGFRYKFVEAPK